MPWRSVVEEVKRRTRGQLMDLDHHRRLSRLRGDDRPAAHRQARCKHSPATARAYFSILQGNSSKVVALNRQVRTSGGSLRSDTMILGRSS